MFLWVINALFIVCISANAFAGDRVSHWLGSMGCDELLAAYLEERIGDNKSTRKERVAAAIELATVYAILLSKSDTGEDIEMLKRATSLLKRMPEDVTTTNRLHLLRAVYLSAEQILERHRLRFAKKADADEAALQLKQIAIKLTLIQSNLMNKLQRGRAVTNTTSINAELSTSLLAWSNYYIALHNNSLDNAQRAVDLFAASLQGDRASLENVALDLRVEEQGARAILGIALCKDLADDPAGPEPWFEILEKPETHLNVQKAVPMWRFFGDIEKQRWSKALEHMSQVTNADRALIYRLAAVRALEFSQNDEAKKLAQLALSKLVELNQFAMVSSIVEKYGFSALQTDSFISQFIKADLDFRKTRDKMQSDLPTKDPEIVEELLLVAQELNEALLAKDASQFTSLHDDCYFAKAYSYYYVSEFAKAAESFLQASKGNNAETAVWMVIISLESLDQLDSSQQGLLEEMVELYLSTWPDTERSTQLLLHLTGENSTTVLLEDLLDVPQTDPSYEESQRRASRMLYDFWLSATPENQQTVGNQYVNVALTLIIADELQVEDKTSIQRSVVRALRILEVSLHPVIRREIAANQAFEVLESIQEQGLYDLTQYEDELSYRNFVFSLYANDWSGAFDLVKDIISANPESHWSRAAANKLWKSWDEEGVLCTTAEQYFVGLHILSFLSDQQYGLPSHLQVAINSAKAGLRLFEQKGDQASGAEALRILRILVALYPNSEDCLVLAAKAEQLVGDKKMSFKHWKKILVSSSQSSELWLEAKYMTVLLKSESDPAEALVILNQFKTLYPKYGDGTFSDQLQQLHETLLVNP